MKKGSYKKLEFTMEPTSMYGHYIIRCFYKKTNIKLVTTDSFIYDCLDDSEFKQLQAEAKKACYDKIVCEYERLKQCV